MKVKFKKNLKIRDVIQTYENDTEMARALSRVVVSWDLKDVDTGEPIPIPEPDTAEWYLDLGGPQADPLKQFTELIQAWMEVRKAALDVELPKENGEES